MIIFKNASSLDRFLRSESSLHPEIGFVPTMGALHRGHLELVAVSRKENRLTVVSIFVNPTQFNDSSDFEKYPVTLENDILLLERSGCDVLFMPSVPEIYPNGFSHLEHYDLGYLENLLEGKYRPGHFQGVCQVVHRLLDIVRPGKLYLGQKDYQQCMVIKRLITLTSIKVDVRICSTVRESSGLAMSSRNLRLSENERTIAAHLYQTLVQIKENIRPGSLDGILKPAIASLTEKGFRLDYLVLADSGTLEPLDTWDGSRTLVVLVAAFLGDVRLIDNLLL